MTFEKATCGNIDSDFAVKKTKILRDIEDEQGGDWEEEETRTRVEQVQMHVTESSCQSRLSDTFDSLPSEQTGLTQICGSHRKRSVAIVQGKSCDSVALPLVF